MLLHVDGVGFRRKATEREIGGIKVRFTRTESIQDISAEQLAAYLTAGQTVQPGVTPFSEKSRQEGKRGTTDRDFVEQTVFMDDIDNNRKDIPYETPAHVVALLSEYNLKPAFMYETFSSTKARPRFRIALVSDERFTDRAERDRVQNALIAAFDQADLTCGNADRIFFGTDKGLIDEYTDFSAVCAKADLLAFADAYNPTHSDQIEKINFSGPILEGQRNNTLSRAAFTLLKKYGEGDNRAYEAFLETARKCIPPLDDSELDTIWNSAVKGHREKTLTQATYIDPPTYAAQEFMQTVEPQNYTDVGQARVFMAQYGDRVKYSAATKWLVYDGKKWNESELQAQGLAQELTDRQLADARKRLQKARASEDAATEAGDESAQAAAKKAVHAAKQYRAYVLDRQKSVRIAATLTEARPAAEIDASALDADGFLLNTPAGTVDLRTGKMRPHDAADLITKMTAVSPSSDGMDTWRTVLDGITCGDRALQEYQQICAGMCLLGKVATENLITAYGDGGNGKSTFYNVQFLVLGDYAGMLSAETLTVNCHKNKSPEYAELRGKRLIIAAELGEGMRLDTAVIKKLCSTDPITAEKKYKAPFTFIPSHTIILYTNHLPKIGTTDKATWDRLAVVPFNANFRGMKGEIKNYAEHLFQECGGAILTWMIEGAQKYIAAGYNVEQPECVKQAIAAYRQENDWLGNFLSDRCEIGQAYSERAGDLFDSYRCYCSSVGEYTRSAADFKRALTGAGYTWRKTMQGAHYYGLKLQSEFKPIVPI